MILLVTAVTFTLRYLYFSDQVCFPDPDNKEKPYQKFIGLKHECYDVINLGTSHGKCFRYQTDIHDINGARFHRAANSLYYDLQNYLHLKPYLNPGATIILPISYFSFGLDENRSDKKDYFFVNYFYHYLPANQIHRYSLSKRIKVLIFEIQQNFHNKALSMIFPPKEKETRKWGIEFDFKKRAPKRAAHHIRLGTLHPREKSYPHLEQIIKDAQASGFKPLLTTTPYSELYNNSFPIKYSLCLF